MAFVVHLAGATGGSPRSLRAGNSVLSVTRRHRPLLVALMLPLALALLSLTTPARAQGNVTVKVYSLLFHPFLKISMIEAMNAGFNASMASRQWMAAPDVNVELIYPPSYSVPNEEVLRSVVEQNKGELIIILGPLSNPSVTRSRELLRKEGLVAFGPVAGSSAVRGWDPNIYFIQTSPAAELLALLRYAVSRLRLRRLGFMYLQGTSFGDGDYKQAVELMSHMGLQLCGVFTKNRSSPFTGVDNVFETVWEQFAATLPQGVLLFASPVPDTVAFIRRMVADNRTRKSFLLVPSVLEIVIANEWSEALAAVGAPLVPGQVLLTGTNPLATDTEYHAIKRFQRDARAYLRDNPGVTVFNATDDFDHDDIEGALMVYGWIAGEVLAQALSGRQWLRSREAFMESLYNQRRYVIDDLVIGDFGGNCKGAAGKHGAVCQCNQGGNAVYMKALVENYRFVTLQNGEVYFASSHCYSDDIRLDAPLSGLLFYVWDDETTAYSIISFAYGMMGATESTEMQRLDRFFFHALATSAAEGSLTLRRELDTRIVTAVFGIVDDAMLATPDVTFVDPITATPHLHSSARNVIHLSPTLEQQLFVTVGYIVNSSGAGTFHAAIRGNDTHAIEDMVRKTAVTFDRSLGTVATLHDHTSATDIMPHEGDVLLIGLTPSDPLEVAKHLDSYTSVRVFVPFFDVALLYDEFVRAFRNRSSAARLLFATSLPHWAEEGPLSETVRGFHNMVPDRTKWTPLALLGFATARAMQSVLMRMGHVTPEALVNAVFSQSVISADDMRYGPYGDECPVEGVSARNRAVDCVVNYGATRISMWSFSRALNASVPPLTHAMTPLVSYHDPNLDRLTGAQLAGVITGSIFALLLLISLLVVMLLCLLRRGARDNDSAPKEPLVPVTLIFTDIESSTALWAAHPELMPDAVEAHHQLIRSLIVRYGCYEVKTVGDSFMIACRSPLAAVQLAGDLQRCFLHHDWGTTALDDSYREFEQQHTEEDVEYKPPTAHLDPCVYRELWNGLRVRVGIHTGLCDIRHDEVTKGYDYYGRTSNMAARTESVANGGQVLLTRAAYLALSTVEREHVSVTSLGAIALRGVPDPVEMYQLDAVPGRTFAALRLDREVPNVDGNDGESSTDVSTDTGSMSGGLRGSALMIASSLQAVLGTFTTPQRQKLLLPLCGRWRVTLPHTKKAEWDEEYCEEAVRRISAKVGRVVDHCAASGSGHSASSLRSASVIIISNRLVEHEELSQDPA
ncbi:unnamed protein product [Trypanosoma congolense IL3000]|uniref:adenylate cyclase n=1 Tax=Trypanosoma congolense (strain IL3000) TaxID=1068625 RepID=F9WIA2_TRYCI|nr:unnamed protein product [Trypanosoma congolense IL3000]